MCCGAAYAVLIFYSQLAPTTSSAFRYITGHDDDQEEKTVTTIVMN